MSNKVTLATIQFRADAKGVNPALDSIRQASQDAHNEVDRLQAALKSGIKTMKDANGVDFNVAKKIAQLTKEAKSFDAAIRELTKGATALEAVWKNIELGTIEKNSRAELKGAINAAQSRLRSIRAMQEDGTVDEESLQRQRELKVLVTEAQKQLNNLDRDTAKFIETLEKGEAVSQSMIDKETKGLKEMLSLIPYGTEEWKKYNEQLTKIQQHVAEIRKQERETATALLSSKDMGKYSEEQIRNAITNGKQLLATYKTNSDEAKKLAENIVRAEEYLKQYGVEAARQAQREKEQLRLEQELATTMRKRLTDLKSLSADALGETRRYWEAQRNEAAEGTKEFQKAEQALKKIDNLQKKRKVAQLDTILGDPSKFGVAEVKNAVQEMEKLRDSVQKGIPAWQHYNKMVNEGKTYLDQLAKSEEAQRINDQMARLTSLSASGLQEVKKYWETMVAGAERGSQELIDYETKLKQVIAEEQSRNMAQARQNASRLGGNLGSYSEAEIRQAIEAGKQLIQTYKTADPAAQTLANNIVAAEEHLKQYGVEAARQAQREQEQLRLEQELATAMRKRLTDLKSLSADALSETRRYWEAQRNGAAEGTLEFLKAEQALKRIDNLQKMRKVAELDTILNDPSKFGVAEVKNAVQEMEKLRDSVQKGIPAWQHYNKMVNEGKTYLDQLAKSEEAQRINDQMARLTSLSASGLQEVKKYWETMVAGAERGSQELLNYQNKLAQVVAEEQARANLSARATSNRLQSTNLGQYSEKEIREAIEAGKQLIQTYNTADPAAKALAENIVRAEEHLKQYGVEAERAARREAQAVAEAARKRQEADALMQQQLQQGAALTQTALRQQEQYWQRLIDDPKTAAGSLQIYKDNLTTVKQLQEALTRTQNIDWSNKLIGTRYMSLSEADLRKAINAAREYQQTFAPTEPMYRRLSQQIVKAEEHLRQFGIEAERTAQKEVNAEQKAAQERTKQNRIMEQQLQQGTALSQSALKAQENYWQRLIDDPKTAANSIQLYKDNLQQVKDLQDQMAAVGVQTKGQSALAFFRGDTSNASAAQIKEQQQALIAYRDSLPRQQEAAVIAEINSYIEETGTAAKVAAGKIMTIADAEALAGQLGTSGFSASTDKLRLAKKALEEAQNAAGRGSARFTELQAAINKVDLELKRTGEITDEVQAVLDNPKGRSFNQLKQAVEQGRIALNAMDRSTAEGQKAFDELAKKIKACDLEMKELGNSARGTASAFDKAWSRLKTYIGLYVGAAVAMQKVTQTMGDLMELSDKMGEVRKTTGFTADEVGRLTTELKELDTRTSITGLLELSVAAGQLGLKTQEDVEGFTEAANKMMVALPEMGREGATEMLKVALATGEIDKIRKQMEQGQIEGSSATAVAMEKVGSTIDRLRATSAATAPHITDFVKRVGAVGAQSGITIDQVAALGSTVDALGMRVEMSATALSRMMPAIRNNAFDLAKILHVEPNTIRELYDTGRGMEVILMVLQHIKDAGMDADSIESMLGKGGMQEVMKELNQQGARAGIVFGGLSQNVDELRRQLGVAKQAYEENIAIQQEYDKMNETTAAKWERLKNQIEEAFVGDSAQRSLGVLIDALRVLVDVITGNLGPALNWISVLVKTFITYWSVLKLGLGEGIFIKAAGGLNAMRLGLTNLISDTQKYIKYSILLKRAHTAQAMAAITARMAQEGLNKAMIANVWTALVVAVGALVYMMYKYINSLSEAGREAAKFQAELDKEQRKVKELTNSIGEARVKVEDANKEVEKARKALEAAKKATDGTTESSKRLAEAEANLLAKEEKKKNAMAEHKRLIEEFNTQYSKYLGFMLSEVSSNLELARARDLVNSKLRETITLKRQEAAIERVEKDKGEKRDKEYGNLYDYVGKFTEVRGGYDPTKRPRVMAAITNAANSAKDSKEFERQVKAIFKSNKINYPQMLLNQALDYYDEVSNVRLATNQVVSQFAGEQQANRQMSQAGLVRQTNAGFANYNKLLSNFKNSKGDERARNAAAVLQQMDTMAEIRDNASSYYDMNNPAEEALYKKQFKQLSEWKGYDRNALLKAAGKYYTPRKTMTDSGGTGTSGSFTTGNTYTSGGGGGNGGWGNEVDAASTDYGTWDVTELVERRKQMNKFKNVLKPGIDVRRVLAEDKALMKAIDEGKVGTDWQSVLNWYNTERKKIQEELKSERFSTNEGNWRDEKTKKTKKKKRVNVFKETDYALAELDRYYSKRKEHLEKAREEENMSEELYNREVELLEQEHLKKRSDLRRTFTADNSKEEQAMVKQFRKWWSALEKSGDLDVVPWATVESEWSKATAAQIGRNNLKAQQDLTQLQSITVKHLNAIAKLIDKERPYDGITANLRDNLIKMDILFADIQKNGPSQDTSALVKAGTERLKFLLGEAETAYSSTIEDVLRRMGEAGMTAWAEEIRKSPDMQNALMAQLQKAYDAVQDAIKKEAERIKRQADIWWADVEKGQTQSRKGGFEAILSRLGLAEDQVKRANSLIGAGQASQRVADKLAIKQMQVQLEMQQTYYLRMRQIGEERIRQLEAQGKLEDAEHLRRSLNLALTKEQSELDKQRVAIANQLEESQNRLYTELREWGNLLSQSLQSMFEASAAGNEEYYNERAKINLTGKGGPGAGTYVIIDNAGTSDAKAHYEYLDERQALERQHEIEQQNARAEAWKKVMDDLNKKMDESITDWMNAVMQNAAIDNNTTALNTLTVAVNNLAGVMGGQSTGDYSRNAEGMAVDSDGNVVYPVQPTAPTEEKTEGMPKPMWQMSDEELAKAQENIGALWTAYKEYGIAAETEKAEALAEVPGYTPSPLAITDEQIESVGERLEALNQKEIDASNRKTQVVVDNAKKEAAATQQANKAEVSSTQSSFAKMTQAANLYGIAYQAMSNDNLSTSQKVQLMAVQAAGQAAIAMLTTDLAAVSAKNTVQLPGILGKLLGEMPYPAAIATFAIVTGLLGGLMGLAVSQVTKSKSQIAQATGASSASAGKLTTGMLTYAEGNVNEFTDPASLTPGRQYNVDAADGRTYRARYMGSNPRTHITRGPEFHLSGERGREMIIDADTTRQITMNEGEIWHAIQTLSGGGRITAIRRRSRGVRAFADGNLEDFDFTTENTENTEGAGMNGISADMIVSLQASIDRQSDLLEYLRDNPIRALNKWDGPDGIPNMVNKYNKEAARHGEKYL